MTPATVKNLKRIGRFVEVKWKRGRGEWPYFELLSIASNDNTLLLKGIDYPDGSAKHDGDSFWCDWDDIDDISTMQPNAGNNRHEP